MPWICNVRVREDLGIFRLLSGIHQKIVGGGRLKKIWWLFFVFFFFCSSKFWCCWNTYIRRKKGHWRSTVGAQIYGSPWAAANSASLLNMALIRIVRFSESRLFHTFHPYTIRIPPPYEQRVTIIVRLRSIYKAISKLLTLNICILIRIILLICIFYVTNTKNLRHDAHKVSSVRPRIFNTQEKTRKSLFDYVHAYKVIDVFGENPLVEMQETRVD